MGIRCPKCNKETAQKVIDKRNNGKENSVRRRRECKECGERFTTYELRSDMIEFECDEKQTCEEEEFYFM